MKLKSTADISSRFFKILFHGRPGSGKTLSAATAPKPLLLMTEPGGQDCLSPANIEKTFGINRPDISYQLPVLEAFTADAIEAAVKDLESSPDMAHFDTVFVDSGSVISKIFMARALDANKDGRKAYGKMASDVASIINRILGLKKHVVMICHSGEVGSDKILMPMFEGRKLVRESAHIFGETYFADVTYNDAGASIHVIRTRKTEEAEAKSRLGTLDDVVEPHWAKIFAALNAGISRQATPPAPVKPVEAPKPATTQPTNK